MAFIADYRVLEGESPAELAELVMELIRASDEWRPVGGVAVVVRVGNVDLLTLIQYWTYTQAMARYSEG